MLPRKTSTRAPNFATLAEAARLTGKPVGAVRAELSRRRVKRYGGSFTETICTDEAGWLLCRSRWFVLELIRTGTLTSERVQKGVYLTHRLRRDDVVVLAEKRRP